MCSVSVLGVGCVSVLGVGCVSVLGVGFMPCPDSQGANTSFDFRGHVPASRG